MNHPILEMLTGSGGGGTVQQLSHQFGLPKTKRRGRWDNSFPL